MKITRVRIENYRSIKSLEFRPKQLCAIVGENNVGKSNIFSALNFILGHTFPTEKGLNNDDFFLRDTNRKVKIEVDLVVIENGITENITLSFAWDGSARGELKRYYYYRFTSTFKRDWDACSTRQVNATRLEDYELDNLNRISLYNNYIENLTFRLNHEIESGIRSEHELIED